ncbi:MAG: bi-domain-containing oxidoreductase [Gammaproteobacteria bacterium]
MKQVLENLKDGTIGVVEVPTPHPGSREVLIQTTGTLISAGTERMLVEFGRAGWLDKARQQPDKVRLVLDKIRADGLWTTLDAVRSKLGQPLALGYCQVGIVRGVGAAVSGLTVGDRVASNGPHAEWVCVPKHLCARIPEAVQDEEAVFVVPAAVGIQGVRLIQPTLGESVVVIGLGLIGLLTVQLLKAQGCRVLGFDPDPTRRELARRFGAEALSLDPDEGAQDAAQAFSRGHGVDAVIIAASTASSDPVHQAAQMCRKRGRIVLVGVTGLELSRADFYEKELSFQVSCSYGPGRYDPAYEAGGQDYPVGFVRWTLQRNFEAALDLMASGRLVGAPLLSHRFRLEEAQAAYDRLMSDPSALGILLEYPGVGDAWSEKPPPRTLTVTAAPPERIPARDRLAVLGAGNYASRILIPALRADGAHLRWVVSARGVSATHVGRKMGVTKISTDSEAAICDPDVDAVVIATRHHLHAAQVLMALRAGKHVFCEKPLCLTLEELGEIEDEIHRHPGLILMVGFNRRFAPQIHQMKKMLAGLIGPRHFIMTVNAGRVDPSHWTHDRAVGGGRVVGEGCHFVDLIRYLSGFPITRSQSIAGGRGQATLYLEFSDGSTGTIHYLTDGHRSFPKERLEVFYAGRVLALDNFRRLRGWGWRAFGKKGLWRQDKGQQACVRAFLAAIRLGQPAPIPLEEIFEVSRVSIELQKTLRTDP